jgi:hypothetical protein
MITVSEFLMGREKEYPLTIQQAMNMADLLSRVNHLFATHKIITRCTSGYRPAPINEAIGGAKKSAHIDCLAIDVSDPKGKIGEFLVNNKKLLEEYDLYLENPEHTSKLLKDGSRSGWVHLDRKKRKNRIFNP